MALLAGERRKVVVPRGRQRHLVNGLVFHDLAGEAERTRFGQERPHDHRVRPGRPEVQAVDRPGTFATIASYLAKEKISLESIVQKHRNARPHGGDDPNSAEAPAPVILITYATTEDAVRRALAAIEKHGVVAGRPQVIRIEKN